MMPFLPVLAQPPLAAEVTSTRSLSFASRDGIPFTELSGLAWDEDEQLLYAVSDAGYLYHLRVEIDDDAISSVELKRALRLVDRQAEPLSGDFGDAEGLDTLNSSNGIRGDTELIIAFERYPRVVAYSPDGSYRHELEMSARFASRESYAHPNKSLETVTVHPELGILAGLELPMPQSPPGRHTIIQLHSGSSWSVAAAHYPNSSLTGMQSMDNGELLLLERAFTAVVNPVYISLRLFDIGRCADRDECVARELLVMSSQLHPYVDNYEGMTRLDSNRILLVSDDNNNPIQRTLLCLVVIR